MVPRKVRSFVAYEELDGRPNIVVDGAGTAGTEITLSHWPKSGTPEALKADSSTEIVFNFLTSPAFEVKATAVTNNHFDEDGLAGVYALIWPERALALRDLLVSVAHAGDFETYRDRRAARIAFTISAFADQERSPLDRAIFGLSYPEQCGALYRELLPRFDEFLSDIDRFRDHWASEDEALDVSEKALRGGDIAIEDVAEVDLAIVRVAEDWAPAAIHTFAGEGEVIYHPMAIHNATRCNRVLSLQGRRYAFSYRYESWVQYISRPIPARVDLNPLAEALSAEETAGGRWVFDGVDEITPKMRLEGQEESTIDPKLFVERVVGFLSDAPPAWDPYDR